MATKYKFDGTNLKDGVKVIANVKGNDIREGSGIKVIANMKGDDIRDGSGIKVMANVRGDDIRQATGLTKIATMKDVEKVIDGPGKVVKAALWFYFCR